MPRPHDVIALVAGAVAAFWGVVWFIAAPVLGIAWCFCWLIVLALDYQMHRETAPHPPLVDAEIVDSSAVLEDR